MFEQIPELNAVLRSFTFPDHLHQDSVSWSEPFHTDASVAAFPIRQARRNEDGFLQNTSVAGL